MSERGLQGILVLAILAIIGLAGMLLREHGERMLCESDRAADAAYANEQARVIDKQRKVIKSWEIIDELRRAIRAADLLESSETRRE